MSLFTLCCESRKTSLRDQKTVVVIRWQSFKDASTFHSMLASTIEKTITAWNEVLWLMRCTMSNSSTGTHGTSFTFNQRIMSIIFIQQEATLLLMHYCIVRTKWWSNGVKHHKWPVCVIAEGNFVKQWLTCLYTCRCWVRSGTMWIRMIISCNNEFKITETSQTPHGVGLITML